MPNIQYPMPNVIKKYYQLTKPGIVYGNILTTAAGFFLASRNLPAAASRVLQAVHIHWGVFLGVMFGTGFVIAAACVINNYIDRSLDSKMQRTKNRAFAAKNINIKSAFIFAGVLFFLGASFLAIYTNPITVIVGLVGFIDYIIFYGVSKRKSIHGTLIGAISGATPLVAGYTAVTNNFGLGAVLLFLILGFWQMPHFYAIGIYRLKDYANAGIPILPVKKGIFQTKIQMFLYLIGFIFTSLLLSVFKFTGAIYFIVMAACGLYWLGLCIKGFSAQGNDTSRWARKMFFVSLIILTIFSVLLLATPVLP